MSVAWFHVSAGPPAPSGALAILELTGAVDEALVRLGVRAVAPGQVGLRHWPGVDDLVVARFEPGHAMFFPHASPVILAQACAAFESAGVARRSGVQAGGSMSMHARLSLALAESRSPLAIDLLLDQPRRWDLAEHDPSRRLSPEASRVLRRLIDPPIVVAIGPPNIGKSSTLNALCGRAVSIVADEPGTTRDHVGVSLNLAGLVVRYIDTPGVSAAPRDALDAQAQRLAIDLARRADLVLLCADPTSELVVLAPPLDGSIPVLRVCLRSDLDPGPTRASGNDLRVSAKTGDGLAELAVAVRERLVPGSLLADDRAWAFWDVRA